MELFEAIARRHSYRGSLKDSPIPRADLTRIVEAGLKAPSGCNAQSTSFVIIDAPETVSRIRAMHEKNRAMQEAPAYIACVVNRVPNPVYANTSFEVEDCAAAVENMLLALTALGYGSVWVDGWLRQHNNADVIGGLIGLPSDKVVRVILPVGIPVEEGSCPEKKPFAERAWFNRYGQAG